MMEEGSHSSIVTSSRGENRRHYDCETRKRHGSPSISSTSNGFCQYSWYVTRKDCSRNTYRGVRIIDAEKGEKLLVTPCRNHGCNCKKIENGLLLVQNMHGYIGHIYEENLGRQCENPYEKRRKLDYEMEELKVLSDQVSELQKNVTMNAENVEAKNKLINKLEIENQNWSDQVEKLQDSLKSKDEEIGSKNVEIESLKERFKTKAKERCKNFVLIEGSVLAKLYAENKTFSDALRKSKEVLENRDKEIENLRDQIDKFQGTLKTKIKEMADLNECLQKAKTNEKDEVGELDKKNKVLFDLYTQMKKKYTEIKKSSEIGESKVKELKEAVNDLHVKELAKNEFMEEFKKEKNAELNLHLKKIITLNEKLQKVEDLKSSIEFSNKAMVTMIKNDDKPKASGSKGNENVNHDYSSDNVEVSNTKAMKYIALSNTDASENITADLDLEIKGGSEFVIKETKNDQDLLGNISDKRIKDLKTELRKFKEKNLTLQDDKIELFEKIAQEKQKNDALEEIISQKEKNVQIACKENTKVELEKRKLEEMLKLRKEEIELMKNSKI